MSLGFIEYTNDVVARTDEKYQMDSKTMADLRLNPADLG